MRMGDTIIAGDRHGPKARTPAFAISSRSSSEYRNKTYAAGRSPAASSSARARPTERRGLSARLIDRPLRLLFPDGYSHETQIVAFIISADTDFQLPTC
ncbi:MAG: hypothetical protein R3D98_14195 [Candidatus Krumholzibacteriia bacterium]